MPRATRPRPTSIPCRSCPAEVPVQPIGRIPTQCPDCRRVDRLARLAGLVVETSAPMDRRGIKAAGDALIREGSILIRRAKK